MWRRESPHVLGALLRRNGDLGDCEDAAQEALEAAARQWGRDGVPDDPRAWLIRVASRRLIDAARADGARAAREEAVAVAQPAGALTAPAADDDRPAIDDGLQLLLLCCHPALTRASQVALTLRAVSGLETAQIAAAFLVPEATMAQRLSRARATLRAAGARFELPVAAGAAGARRGGARRPVPRLQRGLHAQRGRHAGRRRADRRGDPPDPRPAAAAARSRRGRRGARADAADPARARPRGPTPAAISSRWPSRTARLWDAGLIAEGVGILERVLPRGPVGRFQLQAAIAAVHAEAAAWEDTDWPQIAVLYEMLERVAPGPAVTLNRAVAVGMTRRARARAGDRRRAARRPGDAPPSPHPRRPGAPAGDGRRARGGAGGRTCTRRG